MKRLYAILCDEERCGDRLLSCLVELIAKGMLEYSVIAAGPDNAQVLTRGSARCIVRRDPTAVIPGYRETVSFFAADPLTQESGGLAWEALALLHVHEPHSVWLSTYDRESLERFYPVERATTRGELGFVITADQYERMIS